MKFLQATTVALIAALTFSVASAEEAAAPAMPGMSHAMGQGMNPSTYMGMMSGMMNPMAMMSNPTQACASCHNGEDLARYQKTMGPMMAMMNPMNWINPSSYMNMMTPMMDPATYTEWFNAMTKKGGNLIPGGLGGMLGGMMPSGDAAEGESK